MARILVFKIRPSQDILKIRDGTPLEAEGILTYRKSPRNCSVWHFSSKLDVPSNVVQKKRVARILVFKIRPYQEILKIRDGTPLEAEGILTYRKRPSKLIVARILVFKIRPSQDILKIRDGTPLEAEGILTYRKSPRNCSVWHFSSKLDVPSNVVQKKRVARILVFKIRPSQEILKIRDGTPLEAEEILTYRKRPSQEILKIRDGTPLEKKIVARILVFKIRPSQEILKIHDGTPLEAEGILTYRKRPSKLIDLALSSKLDIPNNIVQKKRVARILVFKIRPSQEILKIRDGTPLEAEGILTFRKRPSKLIEILKIRDGTPLEKIVARILVFKIRPSQDILKIRDGTPLEAEGILTYRKSPRNCSVWHFSCKLDVPSNVVQKKRVSRILVFKIRPSQEILKIRDGTPLEAEGILTYRKRPSKLIVFKIRPSQEILKIRDAVPKILKIRDEPSQDILKIRDVPSQEILKIRDEILKIHGDILKIRDGTPLEKKIVARILVFKIRPSQDILKIRDGTPLEAEGILTYRKSPRNCSVWHFSSKLDVPSNVVQKKRVARILVFKIRPSQEILKIRDGTPLEKIVARILVFKIRPSQDILKIRDGTPLEAEGILTYRKSPRNCSVWHFSSKLDVPSNVVQKKRVARILVFKIRPSQEILKIRDPFGGGRNFDIQKKALETDRPSQEILKIRDGTPLEKKRVARILVFKIRPSQEILKIRDGTPLEIPSQEILKIRDGTHLEWPSQEILKIRDDTPLEKKIVARILVFKIRPSQDILKIRDGTPLEAEGILTYRKSPRNCSVWHFSSKLDVPSNVVQKKRVARILVFKIRPSQEILKIRDGTPLEKIVARILVFKIRPSQDILKIRDGTPLEAEGILTYRKSPRNCSVWHFSSKLDVPSNVVQKKRVARILVFKIRPSQEILKIRDPFGGGRNFDIQKKALETDRSSQEILKILPSQEILKIRDVKKKIVARILVFKIRPSQDILKIRDGTPLEAEGILTYRKSPRNCSVWHFSCKLDVPSNVVQKKRVSRILVFKIRPSQEILKIRDGTPLEAEGILTYRKRPSKLIGLALF
ncbi:hypothetical protein OROHE_011702 [Orobanche hederae]